MFWSHPASARFLANYLPGKKEQIVGKIVSLAAFDGNRKIYVFVKKFIVI